MQYYRVIDKGVPQRIFIDNWIIQVRAHARGDLMYPVALAAPVMDARTTAAKLGIITGIYQHYI